MFIKFDDNTPNGFAYEPFNRHSASKSFLVSIGLNRVRWKFGLKKLATKNNREQPAATGSLHGEFKRQALASISRS